MFYKRKEITVFLSLEQIVARLSKLKRKSPFFKKITTERFRIRVNSNRPSLFRTAVSGILSGKIIATENQDMYRIVYRKEPPIVFWMFFLPLMYGFFRFFIGLFTKEIHQDEKTLFYILAMIVLIIAEAISQTNMSEERFLKAFAQETACDNNKQHVKSKRKNSSDE